MLQFKILSGIPGLNIVSLPSHIKKIHFARNNLSTVVAKITMLNVYLLEQSEESCLSLTAFHRKKDSGI